MNRHGIWLCALLLFGCGGPQDKPSVNLYTAMQRGDLHQIERHIAWGSDLNQTLPGGLPPLHMAAAEGHLVIARLLVKHGATLDGPDGAGRTPLFQALRHGRTPVAGLLLKMGAKLDANAMLWLLLEDQGLDRDSLGLLLEQGADINQRRNGATPLGAAIALNNLDLVKVLVRAGANVDLPDAEGRTPLQQATERGNADIIRHLSRQGASTPPRASGLGYGHP